MMELWPFTNFHDLNLDWLISKWKKLEENLDDIHASRDAAADSAEAAAESATDSQTAANLAFTYKNQAKDYKNDAANSAAAAYNSAEIYIQNNLCVTPEMYGAVGDGVTDDKAAFDDAIATGRPVVLTNKYKVDGDIVIPDYGTIIGTDVNNAEIIFTANHGMKLNGRYITVKNVQLTAETTGTGSAIDHTDNTSAYRIEVDNIIINEFAKGIAFGTINWDSVYSNMRINRCTVGIDTLQSNASGMTIKFKNVHFNHCDQNVSLYGFKCEFETCNFGIDDTANPNLNIYIANISHVTFKNCNFECDNKVPTASNIIGIAGYGVIFESCLFKIKAVSGCHVFGTYAQTHLIKFTNCRYLSLDSNEMTDAQFFSASQSNTAVYGAIVFAGGNTSIPRPVYGTTQYPNVRDEEKGMPIEFWSTTIDTSKLAAGTLLYQANTNKMCYYNGTNIVDMDGTVIV